MANRPKPRTRKAPKRNIAAEIVQGLEEYRAHCEGRITLRTSHVEPITVPPLTPEVIRDAREAHNMSRQVFARRLGVNARTLERWEQGRSKPNEQAAVLIALVNKYPDTLDRLASLRVGA